MENASKPESPFESDESFRDTISTVDKAGKRIWVYPKKPSGSYHNKRAWVTLVLLGILFSGPFIQINGHPFMLFNVFERKFVLFGLVFWPQDFFLLALTLICFFVFVILFTVAFGRLWCGWACPQTLFMEMVFRKIEYWIEGDANQQKKLNAAPWNASKIIKKGSKQLIFIFISLLISHTVLAYIIGLDQTIEIVTKPPSENLSGFIGFMFFTGLFYWVFSYFREQACTVVCPYGRLQGVLLVKDSIVVAYDWLRGEPRGKIRKAEVDSNKGDCVDCNLCVHVCPTGIDIRNGTQLECVNCTACMDVCDEVMEKVDRPKGLIRYASYNSIKDGVKHLMNTRVIAYSVVLIFLLSLTSFFLFTRSDIKASVKRAQGLTYQKIDDTYYGNIYNIKLINKTFDSMDIRIEVTGIEGATVEMVAGSDIIIPQGGMFEGVFRVKAPATSINGTRNEVYFEFYNGEKLMDKQELNFMGPMPGSLR
ncbi:MAG: cytochrome c oxidase accessory protein CcoG [Cyclobacteriaceae bacterium]|nr:cytochrome c oxidase accessory protein CcoG [Cyclobacteriaceae bacterium]